MRIRTHFSKNQAMRFTSHLDLHRAWERTIRRAGLPLAYTQGYHPHPRINLACALPLSFTSQAEIIDIWLESEQPVQEITKALVTSLPPGITIHEVYQVDNQEPSLQSTLKAAVYMVSFTEKILDLTDRCKRLLSKDELMRERRGKLYNLSPLIENIQVIEDDQAHDQSLIMRLSAREGATGRPEEVLAELDIPISKARIHRIELVFE